MINYDRIKLPSDWSIRKLVDVADFHDSRRVPISADERKKMQGQYPYYGASGIIDYVNNYLFDGEFILLGEDGANILDRSSPLAFRVSGKIWVNNHAHVLVPRDTVDIGFLCEYLESLSYVKFNTGSAQPKLPQSTCAQIDVIVPPLAEQRKIAQILSTWDEAIALVEALIGALKRRKQGLMQRLLTGEVRFPGFEDEWQEVRLGEVAEVNPGKRRNMASDTDVTFVGMSDLSDDAILVTSTIKRYSEIGNGYTPFENRDVLIAKITPCLENGKGALVDNLVNGIGFGSTEFHVLRANLQKVLPEFLYYHSTSYVFRQRGERNMVGSAGQKRIQTDFVASYRIPLPSLSEQSRIVELLKTVDDTRELLSRHAGNLREQKRGLMQRLLTGEVRVRFE